MMRLHTLTNFLFLIFIFLFLHAESTQPPFACDSSNPSTETYPFCKTDLSMSGRVQDLISRLTLEEKISQLVSSAPPIPRLGVPGFEWWSEALHGVSNAGRGITFNGNIKAATSFPQVILTAASFDAHLWYRIGQVIGTEARAVYNGGQATGMTFWAPNINIFRDPRWGRGQETPGEDPLVTGKYSVAYVRGIQGDSFEGGKLGSHLQASACCKHFTAYDLDNWMGVNRFVFDARVTKQDLADTYQPPFQNCVEQGKASGIMCAYNRVNGVPSCADFNLLSKTARGQWGFNGYITSDCDAVSIIHDKQGYAKSPEDAVVDVLKAGMDVNCGSYLQNHTKKAVEERKLPVSQIDRALRNLFAVRMRLGLFDGNPSKGPYSDISPNQVCSKDHQALALEAARNGIVLLKNSARILPLPTKSKTISLAVIGPNANSSKTLLGNYAGLPCKSVTPFEALQSYVKHTIYHSGCDSANCSSATINEAVNLKLPGKQEELITSVARSSKKPIILVIFSGGPIDITSAKYDKNIGGILWAGYPGEAGGTALAEIIFGDHNPGGRLPLTWYPQEFIKIPMTDMRMRSEPSSGYPGRTYRFYKGLKVFEFGYGLSYSKYSYEFASVIKDKLYLNESPSSQKIVNSDSSHYRLVSDFGEELCENKSFSVKVGVRNHGEMAGKHPVLFFMRKALPRNGSPIKQLVGFQSVNVEAGERAEVDFILRPCEHFSSANEDGLMVLEEGSHILFVGDTEYPIDIIF